MSLPLQYLWTIASFKICPSHCNFIVPLHLSSYGHHFAKSKYHCFLKLYLGTVSSCKMWYFGMFASFKTCSSNYNSLAPLHLSRYVHMSFQDLSHIFLCIRPQNPTSKSVSATEDGSKGNCALLDPCDGVIRIHYGTLMAHVCSGYSIDACQWNLRCFI